MQTLKKEKLISMNDLIEYLLNYAFDCGIGYKLVHADPYDPSLSLKKHNLMVINLNWHNQSELPFIFAHEIGHTIENTPIFDRLAYLGRQKGEYSANVFAINLLAQYCFENDIWFNSIFDFAKAFGIPHDKWYILVDLQKIN